MPKGPKSIGVMCRELGMDSPTEADFTKDALRFLKRHISDLPNATDAAIEPIAWKFLDSGAGPRYFSWEAALNYQWEAGEHRLTIYQYMTDIMKMQRWYAIDRLHHKADGASKCPGCLLHSPRRVSPGTEPDDTPLPPNADYSSNGKCACGPPVFIEAAAV